MEAAFDFSQLHLTSTPIPSSLSPSVSLPMLTRPGSLLRAEALLVLIATVLAYRLAAHGNWWVFALFFLAPDVSLLGYLSKTHT